LDTSTNVDLLMFAALGSIAYPTGDVVVSRELYIDGVKIDAATSTYRQP
jgi:hypothetical protein